MSARRIAALVLVGVITFMTLTLMDFIVGEAAGFGDRGAEVTEIQQDLRSFGYTVKVDGVYGPRTLRAVKHFQRSNGLVVDGIVGPETEAALSEPNLGPPDPVPRNPSQNCWAEVIERFGLPPSFGAIVQRESRCQPGVTSSTGCCLGLAQIHTMHIPRLGECGVTSPSDLFDPVKNLCAAGVLYRRSGLSPWSL